MWNGLDWGLLLNKRDWSLDVENWWRDDLRLGKEWLRGRDAESWIDELVVGWADSLELWWSIETSLWSLNINWSLNSDWSSLDSNWLLLLALDLLQELLNLI